MSSAPNERVEERERERERERWLRSNAKTTDHVGKFTASLSWFLYNAVREKERKKGRRAMAGRVRGNGERADYSEPACSVAHDACTANTKRLSADNFFAVENLAHRVHIESLRL